MNIDSILTQMNILKHHPGGKGHNQKNHAPYKYRNEAWSQKNNLPYKIEYKGKGLGESWGHARKPVPDKHDAAVISVMAGTKKLPDSKQLAGETKSKLYEAAKLAGIVPKGGVNAWKAKDKQTMAEELANHLKKHPEDAKKVQEALQAMKEKAPKKAPGEVSPKDAIKATVEATGSKANSQAAIKTAAAVTAASAKGDDKPRTAVDTMPKASELTKVGSATHLGGAGDKYLYKDKDGNQYLFKPAEQKYGTGVVEPFRAHVQEAASKLGRMLHDNPLDVVEVKAITLGGKVGTLQKLLPIKGDLDAVTGMGKNVSKLSGDQLKQLQREHVVDWLLGNYDGHSGNFIEMRNGRLLGIDKEQSFRFINDPKSQKMDYNYAPNHGSHEPIYNHLFRAYKDGKVDLDLNEVTKQIKRVEAIPDAKYRETFRAYAEGVHGKGAAAEKLLDQIVARKNSVREDYRDFFTKLESERTGQPAKKFTFSDETGAAAKPADATGLQAKPKSELIAMAQKAGIKGYSSMNKEQLAAALSGATNTTKLPLKDGVTLKNGVPHFGDTPLVDANGKVHASILKGEGTNLSVSAHNGLWNKDGKNNIGIGAQDGAKMLIKYATDSKLPMSEYHAKLNVEGAVKFTGSSYGSMRKAQRGEINDPQLKKYADACDHLIEAAPKWDSQGTIYRKISIDSVDIKGFLAKHKEGAIVDQLGTSSWSNNKEVWSGNVRFIMAGGTMMGTSVKNISQHPSEDEIMMHSGARMRIDKVVEKTSSSGKKLYDIHVTEVPIYTNSEISTGLYKSKVLLLKEKSVLRGDFMKKANEKTKAANSQEFTDAYRVIDPATGKYDDIPMMDGKEMARREEAAKGNATDKPKK